MPALPVDPFDATWRERLAVLGGAAALLLVMLVLGLVYVHEATLELVGLLPVSMLAVGKFLPLWGVTGESNFGPWQLGLVIWLLDTYTVLVMVYGLEAFYRFHRLKRALDRIQAHALLVLTAYPRMRKAAVIGVVLFVLFPIAGTGALGGTFLGILLGLHRHRLIVAISAGGLLGGMLMAFLAVNFSGAVQGFRTAQSDPMIKYLIIGGVIAVVALAIVWVNRAYKRALALAAAQLRAGSGAPES